MFVDLNKCRKSQKNKRCLPGYFLFFINNFLIIVLTTVRKTYIILPWH